MLLRNCYARACEPRSHFRGGLLLYSRANNFKRKYIIRGTPTVLFFFFFVISYIKVACALVLFARNNYYNERAYKCDWLYKLYILLYVLYFCTIYSLSLSLNCDARVYGLFSRAVCVSRPRSDDRRLNKDIKNRERKTNARLAVRLATGGGSFSAASQLLRWGLYVCVWDSLANEIWQANDDARESGTTKNIIAEWT